MAGDWIKMRGNLWDDPRVARLCDMTEQSEAAIVGGLYWLWATADQHSETGVMLGLTCRSIDRKTGIAGFAAALISIGWLADHPEGVRIVGFEDHNGTSAKKRCQTSKRVANHKTGNAKVTHTALADRQQSVSDTLPREEKRREDTEEEEANASSAASPQTNMETPKPEKKKMSKRATALAEDFVPSDTGREYAESKGLNVGVELLSFCNWHGAKGSTMKDWQAAWRTWCDKAEKFGRARKAASPPSFRERDEAANRKAWEERHGRPWPEPSERLPITIDVTPKPQFLELNP